jgi:hypothetical protein
MARRKARKRAPGRSGAGSTGLAKAGELKWPEATLSQRSCLATVYDSQTCCIGFLLSRGKTGYEAYDIADKSLGVFASTKAAAAAVSEAVS